MERACRPNIRAMSGASSTRAPLRPDFLGKMIRRDMVVLPGLYWDGIGNLNGTTLTADLTPGSILQDNISNLDLRCDRKRPVYGMGGTPCDCSKIAGTAATKIKPPKGFDRLAVNAMPAQGTGGANYLVGTLADGGFNFHQVVRVDAYPDRIYDPSYGGLTIKTECAKRRIEVRG